MHKEDVLKFRVGKCGSCGLKIRFWPNDGSEISCPNCGCAHEVEVDSAESINTGEKKEIVLLVPVSRKRDIEPQLRQN
jgi:predicted RNA-binding Zn-ribbon protein involved in translation (DUF1610 family)